MSLMSAAEVPGAQREGVGAKLAGGNISQVWMKTDVLDPRGRMKR